MTDRDIVVLVGLLTASIALAGFAGIVTSIDRRAAVASNEVISFRVSYLVTSAIAAVLLSLLPILIDAFEVFQSTLWQKSCVVSAIALGVLLVSLVVARVRMQGRDAGLSRLLFAANLTFGAVALGVLVGGATGAVVARGAYYIGLFYLLYLMCTLFHRMVAMADAAASRAANKV